MTHHPAHHHLIDLGFSHVHVEASWEDTGDAENGPRLSGDPAYDEYTLGDMTVYIGGAGGGTGYDIFDPVSGYPIASHY